MFCFALALLAFTTSLLKRAIEQRKRNARSLQENLARSATNQSEPHNKPS